jgi:para-nitrobenzyl esterase
MRGAFLLLHLPLLVACATSPTGGVVLPGHVAAPPPPIVAPGDALLTGTVWTWQGTQMRDSTRFTPDSPERYTLEFQPGGKLIVRADCNRGSASYLLDGSALSFGPIALTRAMCPPGSKDADFLRGVQAVSGHLLHGGELELTLKSGAGSMRFAPSRP